MKPNPKFVILLCFEILLWTKVLGDVRQCPVLLVHGVGSSYNCWNKIDNDLYKYYSCYSDLYSSDKVQFSYSNLSHISIGAGELADEIAEIISYMTGHYPELFPSPDDVKVVIVAHSMGGLVAREYMREMGEQGKPHHIAKLVTLGTPHRGSDLEQLPVNLAWAGLTSAAASGVYAGLAAATAWCPPVSATFASLSSTAHTASSVLFTINGCVVGWLTPVLQAHMGAVEDMDPNSKFLKVLNNNSNSMPPDVKYHIVSADGVMSEGLEDTIKGMFYFMGFDIENLLPTLFNGDMLVDKHSAKAQGLVNLENSPHTHKHYEGFNIIPSNWPHWQLHDEQQLVLDALENPPEFRNVSLTGADGRNQIANPLVDWHSF